MSKSEKNWKKSLMAGMISVPLILGAYIPAIAGGPDKVLEQQKQKYEQKEEKDLSREKRKELEERCLDFDNLTREKECRPYLKKACQNNEEFMETPYCDDFNQAEIKGRKEDNGKNGGNISKKGKIKLKVGGSVEAGYGNLTLDTKVPNGSEFEGEGTSTYGLGKLFLKYKDFIVSISGGHKTKDFDLLNEGEEFGSTRYSTNQIGIGLIKKLNNNGNLGFEADYLKEKETQNNDIANFEAVSESDNLIFSLFNSWNKILANTDKGSAGIFLGGSLKYGDIENIVDGVETESDSWKDRGSLGYFGISGEYLLKNNLNLKGSIAGVYRNQWSGIEDDKKLNVVSIAPVLSLEGKHVYGQVKGEVPVLENGFGISEVSGELGYNITDNFSLNIGGYAQTKDVETEYKNNTWKEKGFYAGLEINKPTLEGFTSFVRNHLKLDKH